MAIRTETLELYASCQVPRYTSYPTAPHFSPAVDEPTYRAWLASLPADSDLSLYLHVPFCRSMCWYCGCHTTVTARPEPVSRYLAALTREMALVAEAMPEMMTTRHVHFGGGSPTLMAPAEFLALMTAIRSHFATAGEAEIAIEIDPRTLEEGMIAALAEAGVNRASIGVQSFDPLVQRAINRIQSFETTAAAVDGLRRRGIGGINFDLIYGLPGQTVGSCLETVDLALSLRPDRFAIFGYAHVPGFKVHQRKIDEAALPGSSLRLEQSRMIAEALVEAGYRQVGLDHFARPNDRLALAADSGGLHRNFQGYTIDSCEVLIGLGASAIGRLPAGYVQNAVRIPDYQQRAMAGQLPVVRGFALGPDDRVRAAAIERLMCDNEVDLDAVCAPFGADPGLLADEARLAPLLADGLIEREGNRITIRPDARILVRTVAAAFDAHLGNTPSLHARAV